MRPQSNTTAPNSPKRRLNKSPRQAQSSPKKVQQRPITAKSRNYRRIIQPEKEIAIFSATDGQITVIQNEQGAINIDNSVLLNTSDKIRWPDQYNSPKNFQVILPDSLKSQSDNLTRKDSTTPAYHLAYALNQQLGNNTANQSQRLCSPRPQPQKTDFAQDLAIKGNIEVVNQPILEHPPVVTRIKSPTRPLKILVVEKNDLRGAQMNKFQERKLSVQSPAQAVLRTNFVHKTASQGQNSSKNR